VNMTDFLLESNINSEVFPYWGKGMGLVKRWEPLIPVKTKGDQRVIQALRFMERRLCKKLFDREAIADVADEDVDDGIIFHFGRAVGPGRKANPNITGNVSAAPGATDYPDRFLEENGRIRCRLYVNLDNALGEEADIAVIIHEMGHAMGLAETHFDGFGDRTSPVGDNFWAVLGRLYSLPIGQYAAE